MQQKQQQQKSLLLLLLLFYPFIRIESEIGKKSNNPRHLAMNDSQWSELLANDEVERMREFFIRLPDYDDDDDVDDDDDDDDDRGRQV